MRRFLNWSAVAAVAVAGLMFPGLARADINLSLPTGYDAALAVDPSIDPPPTDGSAFAVGGFQGVPQPQNNNNAFSAHYDKSGNAFGHWNETLAANSIFGTAGQFKIRADITCLSINGPDAAVGYVVTDSASNDLPPGSNAVVALHDSGLPNGAGDMYGYFNGADASTCAAFVGFASFTITNGNISIHD
jgi:hypothetical protein